MLLYEATSLSQGFSSFKNTEALKKKSAEKKNSVSD
jgi:hypothetical protein